jgi:hypothetical protein
VPDVQYPDDPRSNPSTIRIEDLLASEDAAPAPPVREGLPRSFRMRADKHYVEMLDAPPPSAAESASTATAPASRPPEAETASAADPEGTAAAVQAGRALAQSLAALRASTNLLSERGPLLASAVAGNLIRAEAWRATCLLQVSRFLRGEIVAAPKPVRTQTILDQVLKSIEPERRLRGIALEERINVGDSMLVADEELFVGALSGLLMATIALTEEPALTVLVAAEARGNEIAFVISQEQMRPPSSWATEWPAAGAARIVAAWNGRVAMTRNAPGTEIRVVVPRLK